MVVGTKTVLMSDQKPRNQAFIWTKANGLVTLADIGTPQNVQESYALKISDNDIIVGYIIKFNGNVLVTHEAVKWVPDASSVNGYRLVNLHANMPHANLPGNIKTSEARTIDKDGRIISGTYCVTTENNDCKQHPFVSDNDNSFVTILDKEWQVNDLNNLGNLVGGYAGYINATQPLSYEAFIFNYHNQTKTTLGKLGNETIIVADAVNENNVITGSSEEYIFTPTSANTIRRAFTWKDGVMKELPKLPGATNILPAGINKSNVVVGQLWPGPFAQEWKAFLYRLNTNITEDLETSLFNPAEWDIINAVDINDNNQIIGKGKKGTTYSSVLLDLMEVGIRGDCNIDGKVDSADAQKISNNLNNPSVLTPFTCDADDNGKVNINDYYKIYYYLYHYIPALPAPFPTPGFDPTQ